MWSFMSLSNTTYLPSKCLNVENISKAFLFIVDPFPLPPGWKQSMSEADHKWVSKALFHLNTRGKVELDNTKLTQLWFYPPQPPLISNQVPRADRYFAHRLLVWMPRRMWRVDLCCPHTQCNGHPLTSSGIYHRVRRVLDLTGYYNLVAEYLECSKCKRKLISWSGAIINQLDVGHQSQFPVLLTYK